MATVLAAPGVLNSDRLQELIFVPNAPEDLASEPSRMRHHIMTNSAPTSGPGAPTAQGATATQPDSPKKARPKWIAGAVYAALIIAAWLTVHIATVFFYEFSWANAPLTVAIIAVQTWLSVGLFIVAHDCMHGSLVPFRPQINRRIGQLCLTLYAGFDYDKLNRKHHQHHRHSGTVEDPDYDEHPPDYAFWHWYAKFFTEYFTKRELFMITAQSALYVFILGAALPNVLVFWSLPAVLSSLQLFTFGTYLPHRPGEQSFVDRHNARSNGYPVWLSLLTCFHFGYHHEHHAHPDEPWWRLPSVRRLPE